MKWDHLTPRELAPLLDDPRFAVRDRAVQQLARQGAGALPVLMEVIGTSPSVRARRHAVWAATRMETPAADSVVTMPSRIMELSY